METPTPFTPFSSGSADPRPAPPPPQQRECHFGLPSLSQDTLPKFTLYKCWDFIKLSLFSILKRRRNAKPSLAHFGPWLPPIISGSLQGEPFMGA